MSPEPRQFRLPELGLRAKQRRNQPSRPDTTGHHQLLQGRSAFRAVRLHGRQALYLDSVEARSFGLNVCQPRLSDSFAIVRFLAGHA